MDLLLSPLYSLTSPAALASSTRPRLVILPSRTGLPFPATWRQPISLVRCRRSEYFDSQQQPQPPQPRGWVSRPSPNSNSAAVFPAQHQSTAPGGQSQSSRVFVGYSIYKGKAALTIEPKAPEFAPLESGAYKVSREGFVLLQFAPAVGARQYDWSRKQMFSLSVTEIGTLMGLGTKDLCEFFHDPFKGKSDEGKVRKILKVEPLPDGTGHFFNLSVQNRMLNVDESIYIPISRAEFTVMNTTFNFIIPYLLGWNAFGDSIRPEDSGRPNNSVRSGIDAEWSR